MKRIYLDHAAATPVDKKVLEKMYRVEREIFANASALHRDGVEAQKIITHARQSIAEHINAHSDEVIFTASGTEANNLALFGALRMAKKDHGKNHIIISAIEHPSVIECAERLREEGYEVSILPVDSEGVVDLKRLKKMLRPETALLSLIYASNEIGTVQPIREVMKVIRKFRKENGSPFPYVHTDAAQATNYLPMNTEKLGIDLMTFNSPKIYGPKGIAALFKRRGTLLESLVYGGGQENGMRSGTEDTARIVGFEEAMTVTALQKERESERLVTLRDYFITEIEKHIPSAQLNGARENRLPNNVNFSFPGKDAEEMVLRLDAKGISASTKSACASRPGREDTEDDDGGSYVVRALGEDGHEVYPLSSVRLTLGRETRKKDIDTAVQELVQIVEKF